jgi:hypothetical protein
LPAAGRPAINDKNCDTGSADAGRPCQRWRRRHLLDGIPTGEDPAFVKTILDAAGNLGAAICLFGDALVAAGQDRPDPVTISANH